jgi:hypothetical protein
MATLISIDPNSPDAVSFDNWVNLGAPDPAVNAPVIAMPDFAAMRAGFDRPVERTPALGAYANPDPNEFSNKMRDFDNRMKGHYAAAAPAAVSNNTVGAIADGVANAVGDMAASLSDVFGGSPNKKLQVSEPTNGQVETSGLTSAAAAFGGVQKVSRADLYKRETLSEIKKNPGNDYA